MTRVNHRSRAIGQSVPSGLFLLALAGGASADFIGARVDRDDTGLLCEGLTTASILRVVAEFDDPDDRLLGVSAVDGITIDFYTACPGGLANDGGPEHGLRAEDFPLAPGGPWLDSYVTVGKTQTIGDDTNYTPGFAGSDGVHSVINGSSFSESDGGWYDADPGTPELPDGAGDIVIAQFIVCEVGMCQTSLCGALSYVRASDGALVHAPFCATAFPEATEGDLDGDGIVGFGDVVVILGNWGDCPPDDCLGDLDQSGAVDFPDLVKVLSLWTT